MRVSGKKWASLNKIIICFVMMNQMTVKFFVVVVFKYINILLLPTQVFPYYGLGVDSSLRNIFFKISGSLQLSWQAENTRSTFINSNTASHTQIITQEETKTQLELQHLAKRLINNKH